MKYLILIATFILSAMGPSKDTCHGKDACLLDDRSYHIRLPDDWDGETALPVMLHFHGWGRQGDLIVGHQRISGHTRRRGVLLIAPNGLGRSWDFWDAESDDVAFTDAVIEDVAKRFPVDRDRIYVSGYSYGANMAWRYACQAGNGTAALLAISGTLSQGEVCDEGPREVRQVYGRTDTVLRLPVSPDGDETFSVALWRDQFKCAPEPKKSTYKIVDWLALERHIWDDCADGHKVTLDLHRGGHLIPRGWIGRQLDELLERSPTYP